MAANTIVVSVLADSKNFQKGMDSIAGGTGKLGGALKGIAVLGAAAFTGAVAGLGKSIKMASDLEQSIGGVESVFKEFSGQTKKFAAEAANNVGLSANSYNELATIIGTTLKNSGTPMDELSGKTNDLIKISADMAATFGGPVTQASNAMASALRGEFEPLRQYGVSLSVADINARALADSGKSSADALTKQEKALATQALIMEQSADAAGAFARENDTLAGKTERLRANVENVATKIGTAFLPIVTLAVGVVGDLVSKIAESEALESFLGSVTEWGESLATAMANADGASGGFIGTLVSMVSEFSPLMIILEAVTPFLPILGGAFEDLGVAVRDSGLLDALGDVADALGEALTTALVELTPLVPVLVGAIAELLPELVPLIPALIELLPPIIDLIPPLAEFIGVLLTPTEEESSLPGIIDGIVVALGVVGGILGYVSGLWTGLFTVISGFVKWVSGEFTLQQVVDDILATGGPIADMVTWTLNLGTTIRRFVSDAVTNIGNFGDRVRTKIGEVVSFFTGLPGRITGALAGAGSWLVSAGSDIIQGLINGVNKLADRAIKSVLNIGKDMVNGVKNFLGIASPSKVFTSFGEFVVQGLVRGLEKLDPLKGTMKKLSRTVSDGLSVNTTIEARHPGDGPTGPRSPGNGGDGPHFHITVEGGLGSPAEIGRSIVEYIEEFYRVNGRPA